MKGDLSVVLITSPEEEAEITLAIARRALQGGVTGIVLRMPRATARELFEVARKLRPATRKAGCLLIVHDRVDVALAADADGVHLGGRSLPVASVKRMDKGGFRVGCSAHNLDDAGQFVNEGADYLFLSPVFPTLSHPEREAIGVAAYKEAALRTRVPVLALGGVSVNNVEQIAEAGGAGVAAISAFYMAEDPAETARAFRAAFGK